MPLLTQYILCYLLGPLSALFLTWASAKLFLLACHYRFGMTPRDKGDYPSVALLIPTLLFLLAAAFIAGACYDYAPSINLHIPDMEFHVKIHTE